MYQASNLPPPVVLLNSGRWYGNDGRWSTFFVQIGTPPQAFHVLPSFSGQTLYIPIEEDCAPERMNITDCGVQRGVEVFQSRNSLGFQRSASKTWSDVGMYEVGLGANIGLTGNAYYGFDDVGLGEAGLSDTIAVKQLAITAYATPDLWVGQLGLSVFPMVLSEAMQPSSLMVRLKEAGRIPSLSFGYQAGAIYRYTRVSGSLTLGGYDRSRLSDEVLTVPLALDFIVGVQQITVDIGNGTTSVPLSSGILANIDTNTPDIWLPTAVCEAFASLLGLTYLAEAARYIVSDDTRTRLQTLSPTFSFVIGMSADGGANITIEIPYSAFDLQASFPIFGAPTYYFPLRRAANESQYTLGRSFLQEVYLSVDRERDVFNISQAVFESPMPQQDLVTIEPLDDTDGSIVQTGQSAVAAKKLSIGAIVGIAIGGVAFLLLLLGFAWFMYRRHRQVSPASRNERQSLEQPPEGASKIAELGSGSKGETNAWTATDCELPGSLIGDLRPAQEKQGSYAYEHGYCAKNIVEADSASPVYELPTPIVELPANNDTREMKGV